MRLAFSAAVNRLARTVAAETSSGSTDWTRIVKAAVRDLTPAMRLEVASANEHSFQTALWNAVQSLQATS